MRTNAIGAMAGRKTHTRIWPAVFCGVAALAVIAPAAARNQPGVLNAAAVNFEATVIGVREVPAGNPMPGLHIDVKVKNVAMDVYIAPMDFAMKYGVKVARGDEVIVEGTQMKAGETTLVLARAITTGIYDKAHGVFRPTLTVYLRNDDGPFWAEDLTVGP